MVLTSCIYWENQWKSGIKFTAGLVGIQSSYRWCFETGRKPHAWNAITHSLLASCRGRNSSYQMRRSIIDKLPVVGHSNARGSMHSLRFVLFRRFDLFSSWVSWWIMDGISSRCGRPAAPPRPWTLGMTDGSWTGDALEEGFAFSSDRRRQEQSFVCWVWELFQKQCRYIRWLIGL